jgi:hypothetical protein
MEPGSDAEVVDGGAAEGYPIYGYFFKYNPASQSFAPIDSIAGEPIRSLVTRYDSIYGGTMVRINGGSQASGGHLFSFHPGDASVNIIGVPISGDSTVEALTYGCGPTDSLWIFGGTAPPELTLERSGGGHLFRYAPPGQAQNPGFGSLGTPVPGQRVIRALANINCGVLGLVIGGTGPRTPYVFEDCGGDCDQEHAVVAGPAQRGNDAWVGGLCRVDADTVYGTTKDSAWVFGYHWYGENLMWPVGYLYEQGETPQGAGRMVKQGGEDTLIYVEALIDSQARFYQWNRKKTWDPGRADDPNHPEANPKYWTMPLENIWRIRSLAVDSSDSHLVYIGTGVKGNDTAYVLVFNPREADAVNFGLSSGARRLTVDAGHDTVVFSCHPNPFTESVYLGYRLPTGSHDWVKLEVYDVAGRLVRTVLEGRPATCSGIALWDGRNSAGSRAAPGTYFCKLRAGVSSKAIRLVMLK